MDSLRLGPTAEIAVDGCQRKLWEVRLVRDQDSRVAGAIEVAGLDFLRFLGIEKIEEGFRGLTGMMAICILVDQGHCGFRHDGARRIDDLVLITTEGDTAIDVFHLTRRGAKLTPADQQGLTAHLQQTLEDNA